MNKLHINIISHNLLDGWEIKKSRSHKAMIIGKVGVNQSILISVVGDHHWTNDHHEVIIYSVPASELSRNPSIDSEVSFKFHYWNSMMNFLKRGSNLDFHEIDVEVNEY